MVHSKTILIAVGMLALTACASVSPSARYVLVDVERPFGQSWNLTQDDHDAFLANSWETCREVVGEDSDEALEACFAYDILVQRGPPEPPLPEGLETGSLRAAFRGETGEVVEWAHVFGGYFVSPPEPSLEFRDDQARALQEELGAWRIALEQRYGKPQSHGNWGLWTGYDQLTENPTCSVWFQKPVAIVLCAARPTTPDASEASLSFFRVDRLPFFFRIDGLPAGQDLFSVVDEAGT